MLWPVVTDSASRIENATFTEHIDYIFPHSTTENQVSRGAEEVYLASPRTGFILRHVLISMLFIVRTGRFGPVYFIRGISIMINKINECAIEPR